MRRKNEHFDETIRKTFIPHDVYWKSRVSKLKSFTVTVTRDTMHKDESIWWKFISDWPIMTKYWDHAISTWKTYSTCAWESFRFLISTPNSKPFMRYLQLKNNFETTKYFSKTGSENITTSMNKRIIIVSSQSKPTRLEYAGCVSDRSRRVYGPTPKTWAERH